MLSSSEYSPASNERLVPPNDFHVPPEYLTSYEASSTGDSSAAVNLGKRLRYTETGSCLLALPALTVRMVSPSAMPESDTPPIDVVMMVSFPS